MKKALSRMLAATFAGLLLSSGLALAQGTGKAADPKPAAAQAPAAAKIDLNSASVEELQTLKGIGPVRAAAIVKGRPYRGKDELVRRGIVPQSVYDEITDRIIARQK